MSRIVVGIPCFGDVPVEVYEDHCRMFAYFNRRYPEHDFYFALKTKSEQFRARNAIIRSALAVNADYVLMIDDDMIFDYNETVNADCGKVESYEFLRKLIAHDVDLVGVLYVTRGGLYEPVALNKAGDLYQKIDWGDINYDGLTPVDSIGGGVMLMKTSLFDKINLPVFEPELKYGTDIQLCRKAQDVGVQPYLDASIQVGHLSRNRQIVTPKNHGDFVKDRILSQSVEYTPRVKDTLSDDMLRGFNKI